MIYEKHFFLNKNIDFLIDTDIREYDMKAGGLSIIKQHKLLSQDKIDVLEKMDKIERNKQIGLYQKGHPELIDATNSGFIEARRLFCEANKLEEGDILTIKKDAIFVINKNCHETQFGSYNFSVKNLYHSYLYLNKIEFYYKSKDEPMDIKNLSKDKVGLHTEYILDMLKDFIYLLSTNQTNKLPVVNWVIDFALAYRRRELAMGYYREMNDNSAYMLNMDGRVIGIEETDDLEHLNILYNYYKYIVPLVDILV